MVYETGFRITMETHVSVRMGKGSVPKPLAFLYLSLHLSKSPDLSTLVPAKATDGDTDMAHIENPKIYYALAPSAPTGCKHDC